MKTSPQQLWDRRWKRLDRSAKTNLFAPEVEWRAAGCRRN
jgi:hypothetical protein